MIVVLYEQHPAAHFVKSSHFGTYPDNITVGQQAVYEIAVQCVLYELSFSGIFVDPFKFVCQCIIKIYTFQGGNQHSMFACFGYVCDEILGKRTVVIRGVHIMLHQFRIHIVSEKSLCAANPNFIFFPADDLYGYAG